MIWEWPKIKCRRIEKNLHKVVEGKIVKHKDVTYILTRKPIFKIIWNEHQHTAIIGKMTIMIQWKT